MPQSQLPETINPAEEEKIKNQISDKKGKGEPNIEGILDGESPLNRHHYHPNKL